MGAEAKHIPDRSVNPGCTLLLVRHGQDEDGARNLINGRRDRPLTATGRDQAAHVASQLAGLPIAHVYCSPSRRAVETASVICSSLGLAFSIEPTLIERDYGELTGRPASEIRAMATSTVESHGFVYVVEAPGAESYDALQARATQVFRQIRSRHQDQTVLVVAHNEINKMIRCSALDEPWKRELERPPLLWGEVVRLGPFQP